MLIAARLSYASVRRDMLNAAGAYGAADDELSYRMFEERRCRLSAKSRKPGLFMPARLRHAACSREAFMLYRLSLMPSREPARPLFFAAAAVRPSL